MRLRILTEYAKMGSRDGKCFRVGCRTGELDLLVESRFPWRALTLRIGKITAGVTAYVLLISWIDIEFGLQTWELPNAVATLPGAFVGVLLAFRTNSSYGRWWEARILWGAIVNDSRTWVRQLLAFTSTDGMSADETVHRMALRQVAWCHALTRMLRREDQCNDLAPYVSADELAVLRHHNHVPNALLMFQAKDLRFLRENETIDTWQFVALEDTLKRLTDSMGGCERIRNTPFPPHYRLWVHYLIYLFIILLPFTFVDLPPIIIVFATVPIALGFLVVEQVALYLECPFSEPVTGTPMTTISRTIEINIRQMLRESEVPSGLEPVSGVLY